MVIPATGFSENFPTSVCAVAVIALNDMAAKRIVILFIVLLLQQPLPTRNDINANILIFNLPFCIPCDNYPPIVLVNIQEPCQTTDFALVCIMIVDVVGYLNGQMLFWDTKVHFYTFIIIK